MNQSYMQDAQRLSFLFQFGVVDAAAIIDWADETIVKVEKPPDALFELSTVSRDKTEDILSCLHRLSWGAEFWQGLRNAIPEIRDFIIAHPDRANALANHLFLTICSHEHSAVPEDFHFAYRFDDAFSLAGEGTFGAPELVYQEFVQELEKFTASP